MSGLKRLRRLVSSPRCASASGLRQSYITYCVSRERSHVEEKPHFYNTKSRSITMRKKLKSTGISGFSIGAVVGFCLAVAEVAFISTAHAMETPAVSPTLAWERDTYYLNSEDLAKDEMRLIACRRCSPGTSPDAPVTLISAATGWMSPNSTTRARTRSSTRKTG